MKNEADLVADIAAQPEAAAPYLAYADWVAPNEPARAELIRVQVAIAEGSTEALEQEEARILAEHAEALTGPFRSLGWHRGFATSVSAFPAFPGVIEQMSPRFASVEAWLSSPAARFVRILSLGRWPMPLPPSVEQLFLQQVVLTEAALRAPRLRRLSVRELVASVPLVHAGLEELELPCDLAIVDALEGAHLPALRRLRVHGLVPDVALLERFAELAAALPAREVELSFLTSWDGDAELAMGPEVSRALAPLAERVVRLGLSGHRHAREMPFAWDVTLPNLRHLELCTTADAASLRSPALASATELSFGPALWHEDLGQCIDNLVASGIGPRLRVLRIAAPRGAERPLQRLSRGQFDRLEELAYLNMQGASFEGVRAEAFPALRRWQLYGAELEALASSPFAERTTELEVEWLDPGADASRIRRGLTRLERVELGHTSVRQYWSEAHTAPASAEALRRARAALGDVVVGRRSTTRPPVAPEPHSAPIGERTVDGLLAALWMFGRVLPYATKSLVGPHWMPPALAAACATIYAKHAMPVDLEPLRALDEVVLDEGEAWWTNRYIDAIKRRFGEDASTVLALAICAEPPHAHLRGRGGSLTTAPVFVENFAKLPAALRAELEVVRGWMQAIARIEPPPAGTTAAPGVRARTADGRPRVFSTLHGLGGLTHLALRIPFRTAEAIDVPPPPPIRPFDTATRDFVVRRALHHWIGHVITRGPTDGTFKGDPSKGSYSWSDGESKSLAVAWNEAGVVAIAHDIYGDGDNEAVPEEEVLGEVPKPLRPLIKTVAKGLGIGASCGLWITASARHRHPADPALQGNPILEALVRPGAFTASPWRDSSEELDALAVALVGRVLAGGGGLEASEQAILETDGLGRARTKKELTKVLSALEKLGLLAT